MTSDIPRSLVTIEHHNSLGLRPRELFARLSLVTVEYFIHKEINTGDDHPVIGTDDWRRQKSLSQQWSLQNRSCTRLSLKELLSHCNANNEPFMHHKANLSSSTACITTTRCALGFRHCKTIFQQNAMFENVSSSSLLVWFQVSQCRQRNRNMEHATSYFSNAYRSLEWWHIHSQIKASCFHINRAAHSSFLYFFLLRPRPRHRQSIT